MRELYDEIIEETFQKSEDRAKILFEILDNWIDATELFKEYKLEEIIHTIPGVIFIYSWRAGNWIIYEILTGHYFEALRDIRFLFESSLLALHYDYFIDRKISEKWGSFAKIDLKAEIVELAEKLRGELLKEDDMQKNLRLIRKHVQEFVNKSKLTEEEKRKYIELYCEILMQPELYWSISRIIKEYSKEFELGDYEKLLKGTWSRLSSYTHFSRMFFNLLLERPEEIWIEYYNEELLTECCELYITTTDLFLSTLVISFPKLRDTVNNEIVNWWKENLNIELGITRKIINSLSQSS
ncbi:MAG: hypothetical protein QXP38_04740 [Nitrososphaerota archaeon]